MSEHRDDARRDLPAEELTWLRDRPDIVGRAAADAAHTALAAMRELSALRPLVVDAIRRYGCAGPGCQRAASSMGADGETYCTTHAPAGSVRVVP